MDRSAPTDDADVACENLEEILEKLASWPFGQDESLQFPKRNFSDKSNSQSILSVPNF